MINHKQLKHFVNASESGLTIIESLIAIIIVSVLMIAIAPAIGISVATRVQSRRVELATNAASSYIDGVRSGAIAPPPVKATVPKSVVAPTSSGTLTCSANALCTTPTSSDYALFCIDGNADGSCTNNGVEDMIVQGIAYHPSSTDAGKGYLLGVRVYRADGFSKNGTLKKSDGTTDNKAMTFTGGFGDSHAPLVEMTTEVVGENTTYQNLCQRLGGCSI